MITAKDYTNHRVEATQKNQNSTHERGEEWLLLLVGIKNWSEKSWISSRSCRMYRVLAGRVEMTEDILINGISKNIGVMHLSNDTQTLQNLLDMHGGCSRRKA